MKRVKTFEEALAYANEHLAQAEEFHRLENLIREDMCNRFCAVREGDVIEVRGWAHTGKKMRITSVNFRRDHDFDSPAHKAKSGQFIARGRVLRKDGTESNYTGYTAINPDGSYADGGC